MVAAPVASVPLPSSASGPSGQDEMPEHTATSRRQKRTDGPLTGRGQPRKTNGKRKPLASKHSNLRDPAPDMSNLTSSTTSKKRGTVVKAEPGQGSSQKRAKVEKLLPYIIGIDLGMWGFGKWKVVLDVWWLLTSQDVQVHRRKPPQHQF